MELFYAIVQTTKFHSAKRQKHIPLNAVGGRWHQIIILYLFSMTPHLGHLKWCPLMSGKLGDVCLIRDPPQFWPPFWCFDLVGTPRIQQLLSSRDSSGISSQSGSSSCSSLAWDGFSPLRNSWTWGSNMGGHPKSSALGCDQSVGSPCTISSVQNSSQESLASLLSLSLKVTHHLGCDGLGDWILLLAWWEDARDSLLC